MQTAIDDVAAKEVHEDPRTAEEDDRAQNQSVVKDRVDLAVAVEVFPLVARRLQEREQQQRKQRQQREQVDQNRAPAEKVLLQFKTKDRRNLPQPKRPGSFSRARCVSYRVNRRTHLAKL